MMPFYDFSETLTGYTSQHYQKYRILELLDDLYVRTGPKQIRAGEKDLRTLSL